MEISIDWILKYLRVVGNNWVQMYAYTDMDTENFSYLWYI